MSEAQQHYGERSITQINDVMDKASSVGVGICTLLNNLVEESAAGDYCSCFLIKTQLELAAEGNDLYHLASLRLGDIEALYQHYLEEEWGEKKSRLLAANVMLHIFGIRVYGYRQGCQELLLSSVREGLPWLPWSMDDG